MLAEAADSCRPSVNLAESVLRRSHSVTEDVDFYQCGFENFGDLRVQSNWIG